MGCRCGGSFLEEATAPERSVVDGPAPPLRSTDQRGGRGPSESAPAWYSISTRLIGDHPVLAALLADPVATIVLVIIAYAGRLRPKSRAQPRRYASTLEVGTVLSIGSQALAGSAGVAIELQ